MCTRLTPFFLSVVCAISAISATSFDAGEPPRYQSDGAAAAALDPVVAIRSAFATHQLVAIGDNHGSVEGQAFIVSLVRDARLVGVYQDIVVEFGNARYQGVIDRFIRGEDVPERELRRVWQDTSQVEATWDLPVYESFFRSVRDANSTRAAANRLRVLLGDPPVAWETIRSAEDLKRGLDRDGYAAGVIRDQVLASGRRALIVYGDEHLLRQNTVLGAPDPRATGVVARLEASGPEKVFSIHTETRADLAAVQASVNGWPRPSLALLANTTLGRIVLEPGAGRRQVRMEEQFDAVLYLGPPGTLTMSHLTEAQCADKEYVELRASRLSLLGAPANAPFDPADRFRTACVFARLGEAPLPGVDAHPEFTALVRASVLDAQRGQADAGRFAAPLRDRMVLFSQTYGPRLLGPLGALTSIVPVAEGAAGGVTYRRYRLTFDKGQSVWTIGVSPDGLIASMDPMRD